MRRHQISGPEPQGQRQLGAVQDSPSGHRGLPMAAGAFVSPWLGLQEPSFAVAAAGTDKTIRPAYRGQVRGTGRLIREMLLECDQGAGKRGHGGLWRTYVRYLFYNPTSRIPPQRIVSPDAEGEAVSPDLPLSRPSSMINSPERGPSTTSVVYPGLFNALYLPKEVSPKCNIRRLLCILPQDRGFPAVRMSESMRGNRSARRLPWDRSIHCSAC